MPVREGDDTLGFTGPEIEILEILRDVLNAFETNAAIIPSKQYVEPGDPIKQVPDPTNAVSIDGALSVRHG